MKTILVTRTLCHKKAPLIIIAGIVSFISFTQIAPADSHPDDPCVIKVNVVKNIRFKAFTGVGNNGSMSMHISNCPARTPVKIVSILSAGIPPGNLQRHLPDHI